MYGNTKLPVILNILSMLRVYENEESSAMYFRLVDQGYTENDFHVFIAKYSILRVEFHLSF